MQDEIILQGVYHYKLPPLPPKDQILFSDLPKEEQYWKRIELPDEYDWDNWDLDKKIQFQALDIHRRKHGLWFMNNGEPTYITGHNYFYLQWFKIIGIGHPAFRKYQHEFFLFVDFCEKDLFCDGEAVSKIRQTGITGCYAAIDLNTAMTVGQILITLQNKTSEESRDVNFGAIKFAFEELPQHQINGKPAFYPANYRLMEKKLLFTIANERPTGSKAQQDRIIENRKVKTMKSAIVAIPTTEKANDGKTIFRGRLDEISKPPVGVSTKKLFSIALPSAAKRKGKLSLFSTSDEEDTENFIEWREIYFNSDYTKRDNVLNRTKSGLYKWFISSLYALDEPKLVAALGRNFFDKYGNCDTQFAESVIDAWRLDAKGDIKKYQAIVRQYPKNEKEAFDFGGSNTCFDGLHLAESEELAEREYREKLYTDEPLYIQGRYERVNETTAHFIKDNNGLWKMFYSPDETRKNKCRIVKGVLTPPEESPFIITIDPYDYVNQVTGGGSKGAITVGSLHDEGLPHNGNIIHATYLGRPNTTDLFEEEVKLALLYFGGLCYAEKNKVWLSKNLIKAGYGKFLLTYDKDKNCFRKWKVGEDVAGGWTSNELINAYVRAAEFYLRKPDISEDVKDYCLLIKDLVLIRQLKSFDATDTQKFDAAVSFCLWCLVTRSFSRTVKRSFRADRDAFAAAFYGYGA